MSRKKSGALRLYKSYIFHDKDPVIDELRTMVQEHYFTGNRNGALKAGINEIAESGGPTKSAMRAWFFGKTKRPQSATVEAAGRAMGFKRVWKQM